jgi:acyl carrier protein
VPSVLMALESFPLTANGKLDRRALPEPEGTANTATAAPGNAIEELLVDIWREVLGIKQVNIHDNFFELGGHSLTATQVIARVHDSLGVDLPMSKFFVAPTISGLAPLLEEALVEQITTAHDPLGSPEGELAVLKG